MKRIWIALGLTVVAPFMTAAFYNAYTFAQQPPTKYQITEIQQLKLQHKLDTVKLAQVAYQQAQSQMQSAYADLIAESQKVRAENKFPESVKFDIGNLAFCDQLDQQGNCAATPPAAPPAPAPAPKEKK